MAKRGKTALVNDKFALADRLTQAMNDGSFGHLTWYMKQRLLKSGMAVVTKVKTAHKGRPADVLVVSGKGRGYVGLSRSWKRPVKAEGDSL